MSIGLLPTGEEGLGMAHLGGVDWKTKLLRYLNPCGVETVP